MTEQTPKQEQDKALYKLTMMKAANIAFEFGFVIALPLVAFGYLGRYLDTKFGTKYIILIAIVIALVSSTFWFYKRVKVIAQDLSNLNK